MMPERQSASQKWVLAVVAKVKKKRDTRYDWFRRNPGIENIILALKQSGKDDRTAFAIARSIYNKRKAKRTLGQLNKKLKSDPERLARYKERIKQFKKIKNKETTTKRTRRTRTPVVTQTL